MSALEAALSQVPRRLFLPSLVWPLDPGTGAYATVDRSKDPDGWLRWAAANVPIVTQWDDGARRGRDGGRDPGEVATSSASQPSLVAGMLNDLDVRAGHRVLDVGAGTGWTAGLLTVLVGERGSVHAIELDPDVAQAASERLKAAGLGAVVVTGDGTGGWPQGAPYDRVQCTYAVLEVPVAWVEQTQPGGVIVAPWRTRLAHHGAVVRLRVAESGARGCTAEGMFTRAAEFMQSRLERAAWVDHRDYVPGTAWPDGTVETSTSLAPGDLWGSDAGIAEFVIGLLVRDVVHTVETRADGTSTAWFYSLSDRSWAVAFFDGDPVAEVYQGGERRVWDEIETAFAWWTGQGRPGHSRFGLTVTTENQRLWLDRPDNTLPEIHIPVPPTTGRAR